MKILEYLEKNNMSRRELAEKVGVCHESMNVWVRGTINISEENMNKILKVVPDVEYEIATVTYKFKK